MAASERDIATKNVINSLKQIYREKLLPVEESFRFDYFYSPLMTDSEFDSKPQVLLIGQYSTGKTTFIRYLLGTDFPGQRIGPEPTTDRFIAVVHGEDEHTVPGNALCVDPNLPFRGLEKFGTSFLNKFEGSQLPNKVLENINLIDTPGILSGQKQREDRGYDFKQVAGWFAERCDLILLLFDAHKLDISDEFRNVIEGLKGHDDKIRCILNKSDQIDRQRLMRVYGALMWAMGKVLRTPEVLRVYIGSFWDRPLVYEELATLFEAEENDLMADLRDLPRNSAVRKINELVKRARLAKVNAYVISHLKEKMPMMTGFKKKQEELIRGMDGVFRTVMKTNNLAPGDFPAIDSFRNKLQDLDFTKFRSLKPKHLQMIEQLLSEDIPRLMEQLPRQLFDRSKELPTLERIAATTTAPPPRQTQTSATAAAEPDYIPTAYATPSPAATAEPGPNDLPPVPTATQTTVVPTSLPAKSSSTMANPFAPKTVAAASNPFARPVEPVWPVRARKEEFDAVFRDHKPEDGKLSADSARNALMATGLDMDSLFQVWELSDCDGDGMLDDEEFALAMFLCDMKKNGEQLPSALEPDLIPPRHRT